jgi:hypothetical protein
MFWRKGRAGDRITLRTPAGDVIAIVIGEERRGPASKKPSLRVGVDATPGYMIESTRKEAGPCSSGPSSRVSN